jgi:hypothetical protein
MKLARSVSLAALMALAAMPIGGQETSSELPVTGNTEFYAKLERAVIKIHSIFGTPLHPIVSGIAPGGGIGAGLSYVSPGHGPWKSSAKAIYTLNNYWLAQAVTGYKDRRAEFEAFGRWRDMNSLAYFGSGPASNLFDRTSFGFRDAVLGTDGKFRVAPWLAFGGRVEQMWPYARSGERSPTIEQRFFPGLPGLFKPTVFGRYQASVDVHIPGGAGDAFYQGTKTRATYAIYDDETDDQTDELFNFRRFDIEAQQIFAGIGAHHRLTLSGWVSRSMTDAGQAIPFALLPTLGGSSEIRSVNDDRLGSDGSDATLRGFRDLRFRDRNLLLLQAEYRVPLWGPFDATVFADAGKVASVRSDLDLNDLRRDFGFSFSIMKGWETWARVDVGFGSGEGTRLYLTLGDLTP